MIAEIARPAANHEVRMNTEDLSKTAIEKKVANVRVDADDSDSNSSHTDKDLPPVPLSWKIASVVIVSCIGFGSNWSSGITGAMKTTLKKELKIDNTKFALLEASEDFMVTVLILFAGIITDRIGGAASITYGNIIYSIGSILVAGAASCRSFKFMVGGRVILALGDIATKVAQYKIFSSWFSPNNGFASTLAFELAIGKIGAFVGKSTANVITKNTGHFAWTFWTAVIMNLFTNVMTVGFWYFTKIAQRKFQAVPDPATGEKLTEKNKKFELLKVLQLPWVFWAVIAYSMFETTTASVFSSNATELIEQKFKLSSVTAGWYSATIQYAGFFLVPIIGIFIDAFGNRISLMTFTGFLVAIAMLLVKFGQTRGQAITGFAFYSLAYCFGPTVIIDSIRTSMWHQSVFGSAYSLKLLMNNSMNIIIRVVTGAIQDADNNEYTRVTVVYVFFAICSLCVSLTLLITTFINIDLGRLQWTRKQRLARGHVINERREKFETIDGHKNAQISKVCFGSLLSLVLGAWAAYFWGVATGNNA